MRIACANESPWNLRFIFSPHFNPNLQISSDGLQNSICLSLWIKLLHNDSLIYIRSSIHDAKMLTCNLFEPSATTFRHKMLAFDPGLWGKMYPNAYFICLFFSPRKTGAQFVPVSGGTKDQDI